MDRLGQLLVILPELWLMVQFITLLSLVKTLVIRGTAEEAMVSRRHLLKGTDKVPSMTAEVGMRHFIEVRVFRLLCYILITPVLESSLLRCSSKARRFLPTDTDTLANACRFSTAELRLYSCVGRLAHVVSLNDRCHRYEESAG